MFLILKKIYGAKKEKTVNADRKSFFDITCEGLVGNKS